MFFNIFNQITRHFSLFSDYISNKLKYIYYRCYYDEYFAEKLIILQDNHVQLQEPSINLYGNKIDDAGAQALADAIKDNSNLPQGFSVNLKKTHIVDAGTQALADAIKGNANLPQGFSINLGWNQIGDIGAQALADAIKDNTKLPQGFSINLGWNLIGDIGAQAFADAIKDNTNLPQGFSINLESNSYIGIAGAQALADAIKGNANLPQGFSVNLEGNKIGPTGAEAFADAIKDNTNLPQGFSVNLSDAIKRFYYFDPEDAAGAEALANAVLFLKKPGANKIKIISENIIIKTAVKEQSNYIDNYSYVMTVGQSYKSSKSKLSEVCYDAMGVIMQFLLPFEYLKFDGEALVGVMGLYIGSFFSQVDYEEEILKRKKLK